MDMNFYFLNLFSNFVLYFSIFFSFHHIEYPLSTFLCHQFALFSYTMSPHTLETHNGFIKQFSMKINEIIPKFINYIS